MKTGFKKVEFTNELTYVAMKVYSDSSYTFWKKDGIYYCGVGNQSEKIEIGTIKDVIEFLESFAYTLDFKV